MEHSRSKSVAFTGHRTYAGQAGCQLQQTIRRFYEQGCRIFWCGMARGFDLAAAESVIALKCGLPELQLHCALPFAAFADRFEAEDRMRVERILEFADRVAVVGTGYSPRVFLLRDEFMVDRAARLIAWYDGSPGGTRYTWYYARRCGLERINLWRPDAQLELGRFE